MSNGIYGGATLGSDVGGCAVEKPDTVRALDDLALAVNAIESTLMELGKRLMPVTRQETSNANKAGNAIGVPATCELSRAIREQSMRLHNLAIATREHIGMLEI